MRTKYTVTARAAVVRTMRDLLDGRLGILKGARKIERFRFELEEPDDEMFDPIRAVSHNRLTSLSQVMHLAKNPDQRRQMEVETERYASEVKETVLSACRAILAAYAKTILHVAINDTLARGWGPIGVRAALTALGEHDAYYVRQIAAMLDAGKSRAEIVDYLWWLEAVYLGLNGNRAVTERLADVLLQYSKRDVPIELAIEVVYVRLLEDFSLRPVASYRIADHVYILGDGPPEREAWEFPGGAWVMIEAREHPTFYEEGALCLVAIARAQEPR